jgi:hypothetical protein
VPDTVLIGKPGRRADGDDELDLGEVRVLLEFLVNQAARAGLARDREIEADPITRGNSFADEVRQAKLRELEPPRGDRAVMGGSTQGRALTAPAVKFLRRSERSE